MNILKGIMIEDILQTFTQIAHAAEPAIEAAHTDPGIIGLLGLNWKLLIAQLFNFAIVLFILWKWVFGPLGKKLEERSSKIEKSLRQTEEIQAKFQEAELGKAEQLEKARAEADHLIAKAQASAEQVKNGIIIEAKNSAEKLVQHAKKEIDAQKEKLLAEVREEAANMIVLATERIIRQKLDPKKDELLIKESLKNI